MFCYQFHIATKNLMDPPTVDSTYERNITNDDIPLVTICPTNQFNVTRLQKLQYYHAFQSLSEVDLLLKGFTLCNDTNLCTSWGPQLNLSFENLLGQVFDMDMNVNINIQGGDYRRNLVFIPGVGMCIETFFMNATEEVEISYRGQGQYRALMTNRNYRSYFMPDITSHIGNTIIMNPRSLYFINVKIYERYICVKSKITETDKDFAKCVDNKIQEEFRQNNIKCVPPWLSKDKQCDDIYPRDFYGNFENVFQKNFIDMLSIFSNIRIEEDCRKSCKETIYAVNDKGARKHFAGGATISLQQKVIVTEKVPNYNGFQFIIDVGSSLGLWLGLSILQLHDIIVKGVQFIKNSSIIKKIKSAIFK